MKLVQVLLINVATVAVALVVYDQLRTEASGSAGGRTGPRVADTTGLDQRLSALEAERHPSLRAEAGTDARVFERLDELEAAVWGGYAAAAGDLSAKKPASDETKPTDGELPAPPVAHSDVPSAAEIHRFRQVREAVRREDSVKRNKARVDRALDKLSVRLTQRQRARIHVAFAAFEPRVKEIWTGVKTQAQQTIAAGGEVDRAEIVTSTTATIQREFAATLTDVVDHPADAEAVAKTLMPGKR
ncbi:MAG: hypothetical protein ACYTG3_12165 [Planctomycetota bacterium]|jgi:hypothetical protein